MFFFDPLYFVLLIPPMLLGIWASFRVRSAYAAAQRVPTGISGAAAAREVLDSAGLSDVQIEMVPGELSDHYDPRNRVLRLSQHVYQGRTAAAVGIAAHEAGHALQHAESYSPLVIRNAVVPVAGIGSSAGIWLCFGGLLFHAGILVTIGIALYSVVVFFQLINLPVEFNASSRAKEQLQMLNIASRDQMPAVNRVLNAAALTYVAATLSAIMTLLYLLMRFSGQRD